MDKGKIIVFEGMDGAGKATQSLLLKEKMIREGYNKVTSVTIPAYELTSGKLVKEYLTTDLYSDRKSYYDIIGASSLYAINRHQIFYGNNSEVEGYNKLIDLYNDGYTIICDRYTSSNLLFMAANLFDVENKHEALLQQVVASIQLMEYGVLQIPRPDITILLSVTPEICYENLLTRYNGDASMMDKNENKEMALAVFHTIKRYSEITGEKSLTFDCVRDSKLMDKISIRDELYSELLRSEVL